MESNNNRQQDELYSQVISAGKRKYYVDVRATRGGDKYITITESRKMFDNNTGVYFYDKNKMFLYKEDFEKFRLGLENAFQYIDTGVMAPSPTEEQDAEYRAGEGHFANEYVD
ncbi:MAG: DUF3276 family protein [Bacteroidales bacterium]|nr:DUF3276 family protein [Bacteroidales bacterium]